MKADWIDGPCRHKQMYTIDMLVSSWCRCFLSRGFSVIALLSWKDLDWRLRVNLCVGESQQSSCRGLNITNDSWKTLCAHCALTGQETIKPAPLLNVTLGGTHISFLAIQLETCPLPTNRVLNSCLKKSWLPTQSYILLATERHAICSGIIQELKQDFIREQTDRNDECLRVCVWEWLLLYLQEFDILQVILLWRSRRGTEPWNFVDWSCLRTLTWMGL